MAGISFLSLEHKSYSLYCVPFHMHPPHPTHAAAAAAFAIVGSGSRHKPGGVFATYYYCTGAQILFSPSLPRSVPHSRKRRRSPPPTIVQKDFFSPPNNPGRSSGKTAYVAGERNERGMGIEGLKVSPPTRGGRKIA